MTVIRTPAPGAAYEWDMTGVYTCTGHPVMMVVMVKMVMHEEAVAPKPGAKDAALMR